MNTKKDVHSPAGQTYFTRQPLRFLADCPKCKFGTVDRRCFIDHANRDQQTFFYRCADCQMRWSEEEWNKLTH